jgi:hypothetical protein
MFGEMARRVMGGLHLRPDPLMSDPLLRPERAASPSTSSPSDYLVCVAFGPANGPAALAVVLRQRTRPATYHVAGTKRWPKGTAYATIAQEAKEKTATLPGCRLLLDAGLGQGVVDTFRRERVASWMAPILLKADLVKAGGEWDPSTGWLYAPANDVASVALITLQGGQLQIAEGLGPEVQRLTVGLEQYGGKAGTLLDKALDWLRGGSGTDPLVHAVAMGAWFGETNCRSLNLWC